MSNEALLERWIVEALSASGGRADVLGVSRHLWQAHEHDLRAAGDLLLTWQVDLRAVAEQMVAAGRLGAESGQWVLPAGACTPAAPGAGWQPEEVAVVVEAYVSMLREDHQGRPVRRAQVVADVVARTGRSAEALERMWSNITHVVAELGYQPLGFWPPRSNVPAGVRPAVRAALGLDD